MTNAEGKVVLALVKHDAAFAMADFSGLLMKNIFDDSKIARPYAAAKTKTTCIVNIDLLAQPQS